MPLASEASDTSLSTVAPLQLHETSQVHQMETSLPVIGHPQESVHCPCQSCLSSLLLLRCSRHPEQDPLSPKVLALMSRQD